MKNKVVMACLLCILSTYSYADTIFKQGVTEQEIRKIYDALPAVINCIIHRQPEKCNTAEFHVNKFSDDQLRVLFVDSKVASIRYSHKDNSNRKIIDVTFSDPSFRGAYGGVIWFYVTEDRAVPVLVSYIADEL